MAARRCMDWICLAAVLAAVLIAFVFLNAETFGIQASSRALGYEDRLFDTSRVHTVEIEMEDWEGSKLNEAKEVLAYELTKLVHGEEEAEKAQSAARAVFSGGDSEHMPTYEVKEEEFKDGAVDIVTLLVSSGLCSSRGDARRNVEQGGVTAGDEKVTDPRKEYSREALRDGLILRRGKKNFIKIVSL